MFKINENYLKLPGRRNIRIARLSVWVSEM